MYPTDQQISGTSAFGQLAIVRVLLQTVACIITMARHAGHWLPNIPNDGHLRHNRCLHLHVPPVGLPCPWFAISRIGSSTTNHRPKIFSQGYGHHLSSESERHQSPLQGTGKRWIIRRVTRLETG